MAGKFGDYRISYYEYGGREIRMARFSTKEEALEWVKGKTMEGIVPFRLTEYDEDTNSYRLVGEFQGEELFTSNLMLQKRIDTLREFYRIYMRQFYGMGYQDILLEPMIKETVVNLEWAIKKLLEKSDDETLIFVEIQILDAIIEEQKNQIIKGLVRKREH